MNLEAAVSQVYGQVTVKPRFPRFLEYRDSAVRWLGTVPKDWKVVRLRFLCDITTGNRDTQDAEEDGEYPFFVRSDNIERISTWSFDGEGVLTSGDGAGVGKVFHHYVGKMEVHQRVYLFHNFRHVTGRYFYYFLKENLYKVVLEGGAKSTVDSLRRPMLADFPIAFPSVSEQELIVAFLDRETTRINELIAKKQAVSDRLVEKRSLVVSRIITSGIAPTRMKTIAGMEWLPAIPSHWQLKRLKYVSDLQTGLTLGKKYGEDIELTPRPYLRVANVQDGFLDLSEITTVQVPPADISRYELRPGDVLMTEGGDFDKLGRGYVWDGQIEGCLHQNHIFAVRPRPTLLDSRFLAALLSSSHGRNYFTSTSQQTTNLASTNSTKLREFPIPLPPRHEQASIMEATRQSCKVIDDAIGAVQLAMDKLHERRGSLITAAVTGQIDVRRCGEEAPCP